MKKTDQTVKVPSLVRELNAERFEIRAEDGLTKISFSASSETPIERWFGEEVLSHEKSAIRLDRVKRGAMPLLFNHGWDDPIGMVDAARVENERLVVDAHLFQTNRAAEVTAMLKGGLRNVSIGYRLHVVEEDKKTGTFTARDWEPYEASIVSVPADPSVGIGRQQGDEVFEVRILRASQPADSANQRKGPSIMKTDAELAAEREAAEKEAKAKREKDERDAREKAEREAQEKLQQRSAQDLEQGRIRAINNLAQANKIPENIRDTWIRQGYNLEQVSNDILNMLEQRGKSNPQPASRLGLTGVETQRFSLARAIVAASSKDWKNAGFELECSRAVAQKLNRVAEEYKFYIPFEVMERPLDQAVREYLAGLGRRDLTVATAGAGGFLVGTENIGFIEMLRNRSVAFRMGARRLSGLQGSVTVPRQSAAATAVWLANEASTATESQQTFVQMALAPKNVGAYTELSRQLLLQSSPGAEGIVTDDLAQVVATAADLGVLEGSGAGGQPTGISGTAGIGSVTGTSLAADGVLEFQSDVAGANVTPMRPGYVTTPAVAALLMVRPELPTTGTTRLWTGNIWDGALFGIPAMSSNQLTAASAIFGDWQEVVVGEWGVLEVEVNPYANFQAGIIGVRAMYSMDVGVRRPFAFSRATSIT
jgi:HK97 family phage major capsid protein/HK97 family phage prohead protease